MRSERIHAIKFLIRSFPSPSDGTGTSTSQSFVPPKRISSPPLRRHRQRHFGIHFQQGEKGVGERDGKKDMDGRMQATTVVRGFYKGTETWTRNPSSSSFFFTRNSNAISCSDSFSDCDKSVWQRVDFAQKHSRVRSNSPCIIIPLLPHRNAGWSIEKPPPKEKTYLFQSKSSPKLLISFFFQRNQTAVRKRRRES